MRNSKGTADMLQDNGFHGAEMKRRIADCRERLRRNRAAQRISERSIVPAAESRTEEDKEVERGRGRDRV
ncbi:MAG TPA: hypothetical protein VM934_06675 [Pyrinomonadaceae bacterium]|jgi:hypothetical protein|nr:hypothetical protein [Pyrinomonadaceae bacterium]